MTQEDMINAERKRFGEQHALAMKQLHWECKNHPTDGYHEVGCPHRLWNIEDLQGALNGQKAVVMVLQNNILGTELVDPEKPKSKIIQLGQA